MSKEDIVSRAKERLDAWEQGDAIDEIGFADDVRSLISMAAANKAAEEGGLPALLQEILNLAESGMCHGLTADDYCSQIVAKIKGAAADECSDLRDADRYRWLRDPVRGMANLACALDDSPECPYFELKSGIELDDAIDAAMQVPADRASRQVANKAEVEQTCVCGSPTTLGSVHRTDGPCYVAEATPPATTGAIPEELATQCLNALAGRDPEAYKALSDFVTNGPVGASTVLTDERTAALIEARDAVGEFRKNLDSFSESKQDAALAALDGALHAIDALIDEVAAQAGQVAVPGLSEEQMHRIARNYFSEQWAIQHAKDAMTDALTEAGTAFQAAVPEGFVLVPIKPTPKMVDATFNHIHLGSESHNARNKRIYAAMIAAAPSPAKESK